MLFFEGNVEDLGTLDHYSKQRFISPSRSCLNHGSVENDRNHGGVAQEVSEDKVVSSSHQSRGHSCQILAV